MKKYGLNCLILTLLLLVLVQPVFGTETDIKNMVENVTASSSRYDAKDDVGNGLDTLKIIDKPSGGYIGVYHVMKNNAFVTKVATSTDILNWKYEIDLDNNASNPTILQLSDGGYVVAMQIDDGTKIWLRIKYYPNLNKLLSGNSSKSFDATHTLTPSNSGAEGTPNIYSATLSPNIDNSVIEIGFNYGNKQARGTLTGFSSWVTKDESQVNSAITALGATNIIDRDNIAYDGNFNIIEGQLKQGDWSSFRLFLYNFDTNKASQLSVKTHKGSISFSNPTITQIKDSNGDPVLVVTTLIRTEGSALGEPGELIYYAPISITSNTTPTVTPTITTPTVTQTPTPTATIVTSDGGYSGDGYSGVTSTSPTPSSTQMRTSSTTMPTPGTNVPTAIRTPIVTTSVPITANQTPILKVEKSKSNRLFFILGVIVLIIAMGIMKFGKRF